MTVTGEKLFIVTVLHLNSENQWIATPILVTPSIVPAIKTAEEINHPCYARIFVHFVGMNLPGSSPLIYERRPVTLAESRDEPYHGFRAIWHHEESRRHYNSVAGCGQW